jgi:hypothetical protein
MKINVGRWISISGLIASLIFSPLLSFSQDFDTATTKAEAIDKALASGRLIMVDIGRANCPDCIATDAYLGYERPPIKQWLMQGYVYWKTTYNSSDSQIYTQGLVEPALPVVTFVQPTQPNSWWGERNFGLRSSSGILMSLKDFSVALPLMATNLPAATLTEAMLTGGTFTLQGVARTNAPMADATRGLPIRAVRWRLNSDDFADAPISTNAPATVLWSATVAPTQSTNVFEAYAVYDNGPAGTIESRHYKLLLRYSGPVAPPVINPPVNPQLAVAPTNHITAGQDLAFTASADGTPPFTYTWKFQAAGEANWTTLTNAGSQLAITNAQTTNAGDYQVIVSNSAGSPNATTNLVVDCGPLVLPIGDVSVSVGGTATLNPPFYGTPPFSFQWKFKPEGGTNEMIVTDASNHISGATTAVLVITNAQKAADAGTYTLGVTNLCSTNEYQVAVLTVVTNDTLPPSLTITSPVDFQAVSTRTVILSGTASDEGFGGSGITNVTVNNQRASGDTASGSDVANWSWSGVINNLSPGTNSIQVVATDGAGNRRTNTVHIILDTTLPTLAITTPTASQRWSNAVFTVSGTATDNLGVAGVWCQTNGVWGLVPTANGWTNWTVDVALVAGNNTVKAYAVDAAGNKSPTNSVTFVYVATDRLQLSTIGNGTVSPNYSNAVLVVGTRYSITATPGPGSLFSNWVGSVAGSVVISSNAATLSFLMRSNLVLQANFVPNPFTPLQGTYNGLFFPTVNSYMATNTGATNSGFMGITLTSQGKYSGSLLLEGGTLPVTGQFDVGLQSQVTLARLGKPALTLNLQLNPTIYHAQTDMTETNVLTGTVAQEGQWISDLFAYRAATGNSNVYAGACTLLLEGCADWGLCFGGGFSDLPNGDSPGSVTISSKGAIQVAGTLADGTTFTRAATASEQGLWPLYVPLYGGHGFLMGWVTLTTNQSGSTVAWAMPPGLSGHYNTNGFLQSRLLLLTEYTAPPPGQNAVNWSNAVVKLTGGDLPQPADSTNVLQSQVLVSNNIVRVISGTISNLTVSITASNGLFKGSFVDPVSKRSTSFSGALATDPDTPINGGGWWLGPRGESGNIRFDLVSLVGPVLSSTTISNIVGSALNYGGGGGSQFVLLKSMNPAAPLSSWTRVHTNFATPGTFTVQAGSEARAFYRIKSE